MRAPLGAAAGQHPTSSLQVAGVAQCDVTSATQA